MSADKTQTPISVILADDNKEMLDTVAGLLASNPEFNVVATVVDGRSLVKSAMELNPAVGVIDISMPIMDGFLAATEIKRLGSEMKIIFLTINEDRDFVREAFDLGASGYVIKRKMASDLTAAIHACMNGSTFISAECDVGIEV